MKTVYEIRQELQEIERKQKEIENKKATYLENNAYLRKIRRDIAKKLVKEL